MQESYYFKKGRRLRNKKKQSFQKIKNIWHEKSKSTVLKKNRHENSTIFKIVVVKIVLLFKIVKSISL